MQLNQVQHVMILLKKFINEAAQTMIGGLRVHRIEWVRPALRDLGRHPYLV